MREGRLLIRRRYEARRMTADRRFEPYLSEYYATKVAETAGGTMDV